VVYLWWILVVLGIVVGITVIVMVAFFGVGGRRKSKKDPNRRDNDRFKGW